MTGGDTLSWDLQPNLNSEAHCLAIVCLAHVTRLKRGIKSMQLDVSAVWETEDLAPLLLLAVPGK
eukprot:1758823-Amphidinium_carterae.2